jgi:flavodoxin
MNVLVIYATLTGNSESVAKTVRKELDNSAFETQLISGPDLKKEEIEQNDLFIIVTSTWGAGQINEEFPNVIDQLTNSDLTDKRFALIGLGDMMYGEYYFCKAIDEASQIIMNSNGSTIGDILRIDGDITEEKMDEVKDWTAKVISFI